MFRLFTTVKSTTILEPMLYIFLNHKKWFFYWWSCVNLSLNLNILKSYRWKSVLQWILE